MQKEDYLRKKGLLPTTDLGVMYTFTSNRTGCCDIKEILIWKKIHMADGRRGDEKVGVTHYKFEETPYEATIWDDESIDENRAHGSGVGDLWSSTTFCSLDTTTLEKKRIEENDRIQKKYLQHTKDTLDDFTYNILQKNRNILNETDYPNNQDGWHFWDYHKHDNTTHNYCIRLTKLWDMSGRNHDKASQKALQIDNTIVQMAKQYNIRLRCINSKISMTDPDRSMYNTTLQIIP